MPNRPSDRLAKMRASFGLHPGGGGFEGEEGHEGGLVGGRWRIHPTTHAIDESIVVGAFHDVVHKCIGKESRGLDGSQVAGRGRDVGSLLADGGLWCSAAMAAVFVYPPGTDFGFVNWSPPRRNKWRRVLRWVWKKRCCGMWGSAAAGLGKEGRRRGRGDGRRRENRNRRTPCDCRSKDDGWGPSK